MRYIRCGLMILGGMIMVTTSIEATTLKIGDLAPDFTAPANHGELIHLKSVLGPAPVVLYFYPKDDTPGCTKEACGIRDNFEAFRKLKARIFGISYDSVKSHQAFVRKYNLPFELLSDPDKTIAKFYGADGMLFAKRMTFVIDKGGRIAWINRSVNPATHSTELEEVLSKLE
jgi:thioredoxin-dependent peroxiredoxin